PYAAQASTLETTAGAKRILILQRDPARVFSVRSAFQRAFSQARAIRYGRSRAYRCARTYARQRNRVALEGDSLVVEQSDNCRNTPRRQKTQGPVRRT